MYGHFQKLLLVLLLVTAPRAFAQMFNVTFLHTPPAQAVAGKDIEISGNIIGADQVSIAALVFRSAGGDFEVRELALVSGDRYRGVIPGKFVKPPRVEYYCYAVDFEGNQHVIFASAKQLQEIKVVSVQEAARRANVKLPQPAAAAPAPARPAERPAAAAPPESSPGTTSVAIAGQQRPVYRSALAATVIERRQIERLGYRTLAEILDRLPGLSVSRAVSGEYLLALRGMLDVSSVLVLLDGQPLNDPFDGDQLLEFPAAAIERVELLREPAAGLYGSGALLGVIAVYTRRGHDPAGEASWGRFQQTTASVQGGYQGGDWSLGGQAQVYYSQGSNRRVNSDVLTGVGDDDPAHDVSNTPGTVDDGRLQLHLQAQGRLSGLAGGELDFNSRYLYQQRGALVGMYDSLDSGSQLRLHLLQAQLGFRLPLPARLELFSTVDFDGRLGQDEFQVIPGDNDSLYQAEGPLGAVPLSDGLRESLSTSTYRVGGRLGSRWRPAANNLFVAAAEVYYLLFDTMTLERSTGAVDCPASGLLVQGYLLECGSRSGPGAGQGRLQVEFLLSDSWQDAGLTGLDVLGAFRLSWADDYGLALAPQVALAYHPASWLGIRTSYSLAHRAPTLRELYQDDSFDPMRGIAGNPQLAPASDHHWSIGLVTRLGHGRVQAWLTGDFFMTWLRQGIVGVDSGGGMPRFENDESVNLMGCELAAEVSFGSRSRLWANGSWFRARVQASGQQRSSYLTDAPQLRFNLGLELELTDWLDLLLDLRLGAERRNNVRRPLEMLHAYRIPAYGLLRLGLNTGPLLFGHLGLFAHLDNVLGQDMRDPVPRPDRLPELVPVQPLVFLLGVRWLP